jgi:hypothetical protein
MISKLRKNRIEPIWLGKRNSNNEFEIPLGDFNYSNIILRVLLNGRANV